MVRRVEELLVATNLPVYQFSDRNEDSFLDFDQHGYPHLLFVPQMRTERDVAVNLHELGHFSDWPTLQSIRVQLAFQTDLHKLTEAQWWTQVAAEIRAWRNALLLSREIDIQLEPRVWNHFLLKDQGLPSYYRHWNKFYDQVDPPKKLLRAVETLYLEVEKLCPGF